MIVYNPLDGDVIGFPIPSRPQHCFLATKLGDPVPETVLAVRTAIQTCCDNAGYAVIDAASIVSGRDYLLKIWKIIASVPLVVAVFDDELPIGTQANIMYEFGVAQALGKETLLVRMPTTTVPSDLSRTEYVTFDESFMTSFANHLESLKTEVAEHYSLLADQLERNPILSIDYLRRAYLLTGEPSFRERAGSFLLEDGMAARARSSVENIVAAF